MTPGNGTARFGMLTIDNRDCVGCAMAAPRSAARRVNARGRIDMQRLPQATRAATSSPARAARPGRYWQGGTRERWQDAAKRELLDWCRPPPRPALAPSATTAFPPAPSRAR